jgi:hypothetical protein
MSHGDQISGLGQITNGAEPNGLLHATIEFVAQQLPTWRDDADRKPVDAEEKLNAQLCKWLNVAANHGLPMVHFSHEERQTKGARVDMSAAPKQRSLFGTLWHTIYDPFLVIEGKRLPSPPPKSRRREYVSGGQEISGGIQRFKLCIHGSTVTSAAIIGYIQEQSPKHWHAEINRWIDELAKEPVCHACVWTKDDKLGTLTVDAERNTSISQSCHVRVGEALTTTIDVFHFWVSM